MGYLTAPGVTILSLMLYILEPNNLCLLNGLGNYPILIRYFDTLVIHFILRGLQLPGDSFLNRLH